MWQLRAFIHPNLDPECGLEESVLLKISERRSGVRDMDTFFK